MELHQLSNLAMMVVHLPVKFELDWTKHFRVRVQRLLDRKMDKKQTNAQENGQTNRQTDRKTDKQTELHQFRKEPSYDGELYPCQV